MTKTYIQVGTDTVDATDISAPTNRDFRNAWQLNGTVIDVDMAKARDLHRDTLRRDRVAAFEPLDVEVSQKMVAGDTTGAQAAEAARQVLRDVTTDPRIDASVTPEELKALSLEVLITP